MKKISLKDKITGGLVGMLVGDALGVPYEFHHAQSIPPQKEIEFEPPDYFRRSHRGVPPGTYSDDGAQALILLNTLLECKKFDVEHFAKGLVAWYKKGFFAVDNKVFDCGIQTTKALRKIRWLRSDPLLAGGSDEYSNGNGSLMRILPLALWHQGTDLELIADAFDQSAPTHGHIRSKILCAIYCLWARGILNDIEKPYETALKTFRDIFKEGTIERTELETKINPDESHYPRGSGYVVDSFFSAKWACSNVDFESTVKAAISLGNDTDTTACIAGGIAGLKYGVNSIPERWIEDLRGKELYLPLLEKLLKKRI